VTPEMKERVLATVNELIDCCPGPGRCVCDDAANWDELDDWDDDGPDPDYEFERRWDDGEGR
jgi:hypothetical protein